MFTHLEDIVLTHKPTHKQAPLKTSNALRYATTLGIHYTHMAARINQQHLLNN